MRSTRITSNPSSHSKVSYVTLPERAGYHQLGASNHPWCYHCQSKGSPAEKKTTWIEIKGFTRQAAACMNDSLLLSTVAYLWIEVETPSQGDSPL